MTPHDELRATLAGLAALLERSKRQSLSDEERETLRALCATLRALQAQIRTELAFDVADTDGQAIRRLLDAPPGHD
jgi:hypothetical protein